MVLVNEDNAPAPKLRRTRLDSARETLIIPRCKITTAKYLMTTEAGGREGEAERAAEWDQRVDQEGEELPDSR